MRIQFARMISAPQAAGGNSSLVQQLISVLAGIRDDMLPSNNENVIFLFYMIGVTVTSNPLHFLILQQFHHRTSHNL